MINIKKLLLRGIIKDYALLLTAPMDSPKDKPIEESVKADFQKNFNGYMFKNIVLNQKS